MTWVGLEDLEPFLDICLGKDGLYFSKVWILLESQRIHSLPLREAAVDFTFFL